MRICFSGKRKRRDGTKHPTVMPCVFMYPRVRKSYARDLYGTKTREGPDEGAGGRGRWRVAVPEPAAAVQTEPDAQATCPPEREERIIKPWHMQAMNRARLEAGYSLLRVNRVLSYVRRIWCKAKRCAWTSVAARFISTISNGESKAVQGPF